MKYILLLISLLLAFTSCQREEACKVQRRTGYSTHKIVDSNPNSVYYLDTVLVAKWTKTTESYITDCPRCCPSPKCIETLGLQLYNLSSEQIDLEIYLSGKDTFPFTIPKGDSISVSPLPDNCDNNIWGKVTEISYQ